MQPSLAMTPGASSVSKLGRVLLFSLMAFQLPSAFADSPQPEVHRLLGKMAEAVHNLNYEGTFVFLHHNHLETMRVIHTVKAGGERERLISLNGAAREVVRDNASVTCIAPDAKSVSVANRMIGRGFRAIFSIDTTQLSDVYNFKLIGRDRVANRKTRIVAIIPRDNYRYGYRIYLDEESSLPLKTDMLDEHGTAVSQVMFTSLRIAEDIEDRAESTLDGKELYKWVQRDIRPPANRKSKSRWQFGWLPKGFRLNVHNQRSVNSKIPKIDHYVISDGLASISVYVENLTGESGLSGNSQMGAVNAYGHQIDGFQVTAVGEVPAITTEKVAAGLQRKSD